MGSMRLVIPDKELRTFPKLKANKLVLNTNGHKPRRKSSGRNLYKKQLNSIRRMFS